MLHSRIKSPVRLYNTNEFCAKSSLFCDLTYVFLSQEKENWLINTKVDVTLDIYIMWYYLITSNYLKNVKMQNFTLQGKSSP